MKVPFGRTGGKKNLALRLIELFPNDYDLYVEPFVGAGNIFFRLSVDKQTNPMVINDLDKDVYIALKGLQQNADYINSNITRKKITKSYFDKIKNKHDPISIIEKLKASFLSNGKSYNANTPPIETDYKPFGDYLKNTIIHNEPFENIIKHYDSKKTFFYLDPPYVNEEQTDYEHYTSPENVYKAVKKIKGRFILSYNDSKEIRQIFREFYIYPISTSYAQTSQVDNRSVDELVISNFSLH
jgi:DNA adenine methylase